MKLFLRSNWELLVGPSLFASYAVYGVMRGEGFKDWPWLVVGFVLTTVIGIALYVQRRADQQLRQRGYQPPNMFDTTPTD